MLPMRWHYDSNGYARTAVYDRTKKGRCNRLYAHRIVAERMLGRKLIKGEVVDHINGIRLDNRRENLRIGTWKTNAQNRRPMSASGFRGVSLHKGTGRWQAQVRCDGISYYCGLHETPQDAGAAAEAKRRELGFPQEAG